MGQTPCSATSSAVIFRINIYSKRTATATFSDLDRHDVNDST